MEGTFKSLFLAFFLLAQLLEARKPNFIVLLTDDQDLELGSMDGDAMKNTRRLLVDGGAAFTNFFVNTPICCPSRTELLTGRYYHNVGAPSGTCMHVNAEKNVFDPARSIFLLMQQAGYATGVFGKVTNDQTHYFCGEERAEGMDYVNVPCDYNDYYPNKYFVKFPNGTKRVEHRKLSPSAYQTAQIGNASSAWIEAQQGSTKPWLAYIGPHAPHYPATPAPWYENMFANLSAPRTPSWNASAPDHHHMVAQNPPLNAEAESFLDQHMRDRWRALLSVDDMVVELFNVLTRTKQLDNTYIIFTSDHGYHLGQWRIPTSKEQIYETDIRVPMAIRGPGIKPGSSFAQVTGNVDVTPTVLDLAGIKVPSTVDGRSLAPFVRPTSAAVEHTAASWRDSFLIEYKSVGTYYNNHSSIWFPGPKWNRHLHAGPASPDGGASLWFVDSTHSNSFRALRVLNQTHNWIYAEFDPTWRFGNASSVFTEFYDIRKDPFQLHNGAGALPSGVMEQLRAQLAAYASCKGLSCP